jgi:hypothetical protein
MKQAIVRYRYMLKTAPPETIEQAHAEAFRLSPEQRSMLLRQLSADLRMQALRGRGRRRTRGPGALGDACRSSPTGTMERCRWHGGRGIGMGSMKVAVSVAHRWVVIGSAGVVVLRRVGLWRHSSGRRQLRRHDS